jgi:hypothetical protein
MNAFASHELLPELEGTPLGAAAAGAIAGTAEVALVRDAIARGLRDENALADLVFRRRHPERANRTLQASEQALVAEWRAIRDGVVRPALHASAPSSAPAAGGGYFKDDARLRTVPLPASPQLQLGTVPAGRARHLATLYNRLGGLIAAVARRTGIEVAAVLAVWYTESGGEPQLPGRATLRFENHLLYRLWGNANAALFDAHFRFGGRGGATGKPWQAHEFRESDAGPWTKFHIDGRQDLEYRALALASRVAGEQIALQCASIGGPQILMSAYRTLGYATPRSMWDAFQADERWQVLGFFDWCAQRRVNDPVAGAGDMLRFLRTRTWDRFAYWYNGPGQVPFYAQALAERYAAGASLPIPR